MENIISRRRFVKLGFAAAGTLACTNLFACDGLNRVSNYGSPQQSGGDNNSEVTPSTNMISGDYAFADSQGYQYSVRYDIDVSFQVDTAEGKPGTVGIRRKLNTATLTLTNNTPGKNAPTMNFDAIPIFDLGQNVYEDEVGLLGAYNVNSRYNNRGFWPYHDASLGYGSKDTTYIVLGIYSLSLLDPTKVTTVLTPQNLAIGQSLKWDFRKITDSISNPGYILTVPESFSDKLSNCLGWAVYPQIRWDKDTQFKSWLGPDNYPHEWGGPALPYNPIA